MKHRMMLNVLVAVALAALGQGARAQTSYSVVEIGTLAGTDKSYPIAINDGDAASVKVVGDTALGSSKKRGFYWSSATGIRDVGVIGLGSYSQALSVNRHGEVVGQSATTSTGGYVHAMYWNPGLSGPVDLAPASTTPWTSSHAFTINDSGVIMGHVNSAATGILPAYWKPHTPGARDGVYDGPIVLTGLPGALVTGSWFGMGKYVAPNSDLVYEVPDSSNVKRAALWKNIGSSTADPTYGDPVVIPPPAGAPSGARMRPFVLSVATVSGGGTKLLVAGDWYDGTNSRSWVWAEGDAYATDIGILNSSSGPQIWGLNDLGQVAGHVAVTIGKGSQYRAMAWNATDGLLNLGTLGGTNSRSYGTSSNGMGYTINNSGQVVGFSNLTRDREAHAFIWTKALGMRDLNAITLTPNKGPYSYFSDAAGITNSGHITGTGVKSAGGATTFLLVPSP